MPDNDLVYKYRFLFEDKREKTFEIRLDPKSLTQRDKDDSLRPEWTKLEFHRCPTCQLDPADTEYCPVAASLYKPIVIFRDFISYEEANVYIETPKRTYRKNTNLHLGLSSMVGVYMATSGCPAFEKLKPMVRYHLPFADEDETSYRALSMYLLAQFLIYKQGGTPDWDLKGLASMYDNIMKVNKSFVERLQNIPVKDASLNAVITLDCFAMTVSFTLTQNMLDELYEQFSMYLD